eukprot:CAMPEP_0198238934 /NCGR_PEP_ID=MMETSP1446-20131203/4471_1 /TAXON_ID=1461542 ORGANISM="Unidentified sp, Strain CCMP2111" /NCGR_SAMPLE_ID=MMETSP1446 /ASSEMBLY_ACC=CAM_ASM_001112 /LENGTH=344 /DNA_ID=CAMNT_0043921439 /DNA_START=175 /DNA_END=1209 /DNA_ORIENTATION=-
MDVLSSCFRAVFTSLSGAGGGEVDLNGRVLKVLRVLGEGGYSFVYLVRDAQSGEELALKKMLCQSSEQLEDARREIEVMQTFKHAALLELIDSDTHRAGNRAQGVHIVHFLFKAYKDGTLLDLVEGSDYVHPIITLRIFLSVCEGVQCMHTSTGTPYAHRDIKPHNVLLERKTAAASQVKVLDHFSAVLMDFGSSRPARVTVDGRMAALRLQEEAEAHSTATYRAPELFDVPSQFALDERSDVWSLGCLLYYMVFGQSPFEHVLAQSGGSLALAVLSGKIPWPEKGVSFDARLVALAKMCLVQEMAERPQLAEVLEETKKCLEELIGAIPEEQEALTAVVPKRA